MTEHIEIAFVPFVHERDLVHLDASRWASPSST